MPKHYDYEIAKGWQSEAKLSDLPEQKVKVQQIIIQMDKLPIEATGWRKHYPSWEKVSQITLWTDDEFNEFCQILSDHNFVREPKHAPPLENYIHFLLRNS